MSGACCLKAGPPSTAFRDGAGNRNRTRDLLITNQLLYQLSYAGGTEILLDDPQARATARRIAGRRFAAINGGASSVGRQCRCT